MPNDRTKSPVGWYVGSYLLRLVRTGASPRKRFLSWENTVLVKATGLDQAYAKIEKLGRSKTESYRGDPAGIPVRWIFVGVTDLLPLYERLQDGAEIMWEERSPRSLGSLRKLVTPKARLLGRLR